MSGEAWAEEAQRVLLALAELASSRERDEAPAGSIPLDWFHWLPVGDVALLRPAWPSTRPDVPAGTTWLRSAVGVPEPEPILLEPGLAERLAAVDQVRTVSSALRVGWLFVAGEVVAPDGVRRRVFQPLVTRPVRVRRSSPLGRRGLVPAGDTTVTPHVDGAARRDDLERSIEIGGGALEGAGYGPAIPEAMLGRLTRLAGFARQAAAAAGIPATRIVAAGDAPSALMGSDPPVIVAGLAVYAVTDGSAGSRPAHARCLGDGDGFAAVTCTVHPDGPAGHVERQLSLRRAGWPQRDAFPSRWAERRGELLVELGRLVQGD